jgi:hypothetical protein
MNLKSKFLPKCLFFFLLMIFSLLADSQARVNQISLRWHRGDIHHFEMNDRSHWSRGRWKHQNYNGRIGWWWVVGPSWYYYSRPIYPYPDPYTPSVYIIPSQSSSSVMNWYYCESLKEYYPYVDNCPSGWKVVPAIPPKK